MYGILRENEKGYSDWRTIFVGTKMECEQEMYRLEGDLRLTTYEFDQDIYYCTHNKLFFNCVKLELDRIYCIDLDMYFFNFELFKEHLKEQNYKLNDVPTFRKE